MAENIHAIISNKHKSSRSISSHPSGDHSDQCSKKIDQTNLNENNFDEDDDIHILGRSTKISVDLNFSSPSPIKPNLSSSNTKTNENNNLALNKNSFADQNNQQSRPKHFNDGNNAFIRDQRASTGSSSSSLLPNESTQQTFHSFTESFFNHSNPIKFSKPNRNMQANEYISPVSPEQDEYTEWETVPRLVATRNRLHRRLCYHFMSPIDKWNIKKRFPWKMLLQAIKIIFVTLQVVLFGNTYTEKLEINDNMLTTIHKTFLLNWDPTRESKSIPPLMPYAVYTIDDIYSHIDNAVINYANITKLSAASFGYQVKKENPFQSSSSEPLRMSIITSCYERYTNVTLNPSFGSYYIDANIIKNCFSIDNIYPPGSDLWRTFSFYQYLQKNHPEQIDLSSLILLSIKFPLRVIVLNTLSMMNLPQCFDLDAEIHFNNKPHTGSIIVNMILKKNPIECKGNLKVDKHHVQLNEFVILLNFSVLIICFCSLLLCLRTLVKNFSLQKKTQKFFISAYKIKLKLNSLLHFIDGWILMILMNDLLLIAGTTINLLRKLNVIGSHHINFIHPAQVDNLCSAFLGVGLLLVWFGILRYLTFFDQYNILIITIKHSLLRVLRFTSCVMVLYGGFCFSGWIVLGPYHFKFYTLSRTSECLFALLNGDDVFATFTYLDTSSTFVWWFSRIYLYTYILLFIYIVLSLFIAILMDSYETIKQYYLEKNNRNIKIDFSWCDDQLSRFLLAKFYNDDEHDDYEDDENDTINYQAINDRNRYDCNLISSSCSFVSGFCFYIYRFLRRIFAVICFRTNRIDDDDDDADDDENNQLSYNEQIRHIN